MARDNLSRVNISERLTELRSITKSLQQMMEPGSGKTNADVLHALHESKVFTLDPRLLSYLNLPLPSETQGDANTETNKEDDGEELTKEVAAMDAFLACPASQFWGYFHYVHDESPFSTQQGIKGAEFERVLVVLDDDEGTHMQFSYDKYLGLKPLSDRDAENLREGKETAVERTRRLFYVCCTRAMKDLVVVLFTNDVAGGQRQIAALGLFPVGSIHTENELVE